MVETCDAVEARAAIERPFPGLRSFNSDEAHLFFGRDGQSKRVAALLREHRFAAVVGTSGCGKSSLVRAGLLPTLHAGGMDPSQTKWRVAELRPQDDPFGALGVALGTIRGPADADEGWLRSGSSALIGAVDEARKRGALGQDENLLVLVDQFEELFRYHIPGSSVAADRDEKAEFVSLLLRAASRPEARVYVALTLRSDFLGDCAQFRDLPEAINASQYLVPRMTREERRAAIEGPARVAGAAVSPQLVRTLLNELGDDPDQLPVLQHALMRTWDRWLLAHDPERPIDVADYRAIGSLQDALGRHADEVAVEVAHGLGADAEILVKRVFQRLRIVDPQGRETRSPATVRELAEAANATPDEVRAVLDQFRDDTRARTFLTPFRSVQSALDDDTPVDVTHEALLRCWPKLKDEWVPEEERSRRIYTRLATLAESEGTQHETSLRGTALAITAEWWDERKPSRTWAARYHSRFEAAKEYLALSRDTERREADDRRREAEARRVTEERLERARAGRWVLGAVLAAAVVVITVGAYAFRVLSQKNAQNLTFRLAMQASAASSQGGKAIEPSLLLGALAWDPLESTCRHASLSIL